MYIPFLQKVWAVWLHRYEYHNAALPNTAQYSSGAGSMRDHRSKSGLFTSSRHSQSSRQAIHGLIVQLQSVNSRKSIQWSQSEISRETLSQQATHCVFCWAWHSGFIHSWFYTFLVLYILGFIRSWFYTFKSVLNLSAIPHTAQRKLYL